MRRTQVSLKNKTLKLTSFIFTNVISEHRQLEPEQIIYMRRRTKEETCILEGKRPTINSPPPSPIPGKILMIKTWLFNVKYVWVDTKLKKIDDQMYAR